MAVIPYISFKNSAREAVNFYMQALDGENLSITTYGDMPENPEFPLTEEDKKLVANALLNVVGGTIMLSDMVGSMQELTVGDNMAITLIYKDKVALKKHFENMANGGTIYMPLEETPWTDLFGIVGDKFGITWQMSYNTEEYYK